MRAPLCSLVVVSFILATPVHGAVINVDFSAGTMPSSQSGLAAAPDAAGSAAYWNAIHRDGTKDKVEVIPLLDSAGQGSSVTLSLGVQGGYHSGGAGDQEIGGAGGAYSGLMSDYMFIDSGGSALVTTLSGTLSGLMASNYYDLYFYGQGDKFSGNVYKGQNTLFTINGVSKQTGWDGVHGGDGLLVEGVEFVKFTVQADVQGKISFSWANVVGGVNVPSDADGFSTRYAAFNGMQIVHNVDVIPEPAAGVLGTVGALGLLRRRRQLSYCSSSSRIGPR